MKTSVWILVLFTLFACSNQKDSNKAQTLEIIEAEKPLIKLPKNIILMIGDGMGISQITAGMYANGNKLNLERCKVIGLIKTNSEDDLITDSAAGATAFATGKKTKNGKISQSMKDSINYKTFIEYAEENNKATGIVVTSTVTHATPACFYAHFPRRYEANEPISAQFINSGVDVLIGGGEKYFEKRSDGRNLYEELKSKNYTVLDTLTEDFSTEGISKMIYLYSPTQPGKLVFEKGDNAPSRGPILPLATEKALEVLKKDTNGFFMMVEGSQIDWGGHNNDSPYIIREMIDFDNAIQKVLDFADQDGETLVIITADHETGGYAIIGGDLDGTNLVGGFSTLKHSAAMIPVFAYGQGAENFVGIYDNTQIFYKMMEAFQFSLDQ
ncbi:MAG: alkaline phosphatase [Flavobacteriales bacterium]|nr:alkaline phosphatase [Flavobacteriales bacterium]